MPKNTGRMIILAAIAVAAIIFFNYREYFSLELLKAQQQAINGYRDAHPLAALVLYGVLYVLITGFSLPGATIMTLAGGALFGLLWGTVIVSFASTIGAVLAFWAARFLFREPLEARFASLLQSVNQGMAEEGGYYLFTLRLIPLFPFFAVNLVMGLTQMKTWTYFWISQLGMLPGTLLYVNAGTQLANINSLSDIASPVLVGSFALLGLFPLAAKKIIGHLRDEQSPY